MTHRWIAAAAGTAWLVSIPFGAFIHHGMLGRVYAANAATFRPDPEIIRRLPIGYAAQLIGFSIAAWMYARLYSGGRGILEGLRFGALIGMVLVSFAFVLCLVICIATRSGIPARTRSPKGGSAEVV
jgi:hypothetical protein